MTIEVTNSKVIIGFGLLGISSGFLALSAFYLFMASSVKLDILLPDDVYSGCTSCSQAIELIFSEAKVFAIIGGIIGSFGAWFLISGDREMHLTVDQSM